MYGRVWSERMGPFGVNDLVTLELFQQASTTSFPLETHIATQFIH